MTRTMTMRRMPDGFIWFPQGGRVDSTFCSQPGRDCSLCPYTDDLDRITITFSSQIAELNSPA